MFLENFVMMFGCCFPMVSQQLTSCRLFFQFVFMSLESYIFYYVRKTQCQNKNKS